MTTEQLARCVNQATNNRYQFVCTPAEFRWRYGIPTTAQVARLERHICLCKDGMIRPR
jgi:hypothetical protein